jgi:hypothetical protein
MFSIVVCVIVGILVFLCGYLAGWVNCHSKINVGAHFTSTNSKNLPCNCTTVPLVISEKCRCGTCGQIWIQ